VSSVALQNCYDRSLFWKDIKAKVLKWSKYNLGDLEGRSLKIGKCKSVRTITMDNSKSNINLTQILAALQHLQQENAVLRDSVTRLQNQPPPPAPVLPALAMVAPEPKISLPEKFDGTRFKFWSFVSQVRLIMQLHPRRYFDDTTCVGFIGTLLTGTAAAWFAPILETSSLSYKISTPLWRNLK